MGDNQAFKLALELEILKSSQVSLQRQLDDLSKSIEPLNLQINFDSRSIIGQIDSVQKSIDTKLKNKIQIFDTTNGSKDLVKEVEKVSNKLGEVITKTTKYDKSTGDVTKELVEQNVNYEKQISYMRKVEGLQSQIGKEISRTYDLSKNNKGFIDEEELSKARKLFNDIAINTDSMDTDLTSVQKEINGVVKALDVAEKKATKMASAIKTAQVKQYIDTEERKENVNNQAIYDRTASAIDQEIQKRKEAGEIFSKQLQERMNTQYKLGELMAKDIDKEIAGQKRLEKQVREVGLAKKESIAKIDNIIKSQDGADTKWAEDIKKKLGEIDPKADDAKLSIRELNAEIKEFGVSAKMASTTSNSFADSLKRWGLFVSIYDILQLGKRAVSEMVESIFALDHALVELQKTSSLSGDELEKFVNKAYDIGNQIARTGSDVINASGEFSKAGYGSEDLANLSKTALLLTNVGDGISSVSEASGTLISAMKGFNIEASNSISIVDKINAVSNSTASNFEDISFALQRMSGTMGMANVNIDQAIGMFTASNEIIRNAEMVSSGINSLFMRMRGLSQETGESIDGLVPKLQELYAGVNVDMTDSTGQLRSTFDVLSDLSEVWSTLSTNQKQFFAQESAGVRQSKIFVSLMENFDTVNKSVVTSLSSTGSAMQENEKYMQSLEGKLNNLKSSFEQLSTTTINSDAVKDIIDMTTNIIKLTEASGGLTTVFIGLGMAWAALKLTSTSGGISGLITSLTTLTFTAETSTLALNALNMAKNLLIGGAIVAGVMAIGASIKYISESSDRAREKVSALNEELTSLSSSKLESDKLAKQYEELNKLSKAQGLNNEQQEEFSRIQNELAKLIPQVSGYYDEQGNFIITETDLISKLNEVYKELIDTKRQEKAETARSLIGEDLKSYEEDLETLDNLKEKQQAYIKSINGESLTDDERYTVSIASQYSSIETALEGTNNNISNINKEIKSSTDGIKQSILDVVVATEEWDSLTDVKANAIRKVISEADIDSIEEYATSIEGGTFSVKDFIDNMLRAPDVIQEIANATRGAGENLDYMGNKILSLEDATKTFDSIGGSIETLSSLAKELTDNNILSGESISKIISGYPDLIQYLDDELTLKDAIISKIGEEEETQKQALKSMLNASEDYYNQKILMDDTTKSELEKNINDYVNNLGVGYNVDLDNYTSMEQAKAGITNDLINQLSAAWAKYFKTIATTIGATPTMRPEDMTGEMYGKLSTVEKNMMPNASKIANDIAKAFDAIEMPEIKIGDSKKSSNKKDKSGKDNSTYIKSLYQSMVDSILSGGKEVEKAIEDTNLKIQKATLLGDNDLELEQSNKLSELFKQERDKQAEMAKQLDVELNKMRGDLSKTGMFKGMDLGKLDNLGLDKVVNDIDKKLQGANEKEKSRLEGLKSIITDVGDVYLSTLEKREDLSRVWHEKEIQRQQQEIDNIERKYELIRKGFESERSMLEVEKMLVDEKDFDGLEDLVEKEMDIIAKEYQACLDKIRDLREQGLMDTEESIEAEKNLYIDLYKQQISLSKQLGEQRKTEKLNLLKEEQDRLKEQYDSSKDLLKMTMDMIKQRYEEEKKLIQDNIKDKEDAIKAELDGYKKIIDRKKNALQDEKDERDYNKGLTEKQNNFKRTEDKLIAMSADNSLKAQAEKKKLEEELQKYREELDDYQYDKSIEQQQEALDEEYDRYEESKNKELDAFKQKKEEELKLIEDMVSKESSLRKKATEYLKSQGKSAYDELKKYNNEYCTMSTDEFESMWSNAQSALDSYTSGSMGLIDVMSQLAQEMKRVADESNRIQNASWKEFVDEDAYGKPSVDKPSNKPNDQSNVSNDTSNNPSNGLSEKSKQQKSQQAYLHDLMIKAKKENNTALQNWIRSERKKWDLNPDTGAIIKQWHTGLKAGRVGDGLKPNELIAKLTDKEWVFTDDQFGNLTKNVSTLISGDGKTTPKIEVYIEKIMDVDKIDKNVDIDSLMKKVEPLMYSSLKNTFKLAGFKV